MADAGVPENETTADFEQPNSNRRRLLEIDSGNVRSFMRDSRNCHMLLKELKKGDDWIVDWFWDEVLSTDFAFDFFQLQSGWKVFSGWIDVASSRKITDMLRRFHTFGPQYFVHMASDKLQHGVVLSFIYRGKNHPYQVDLMVALLKRGGSLLFRNKWGYLVLITCLYSFNPGKCRFIFAHIRDYLTSCVRDQSTGRPNKYFSTMIDVCFQLGSLDWVHTLCTDIAKEAHLFWENQIGTRIILNLLDDSHGSLLNHSKLKDEHEKIRKIKEVLMQKLISELPKLSCNLLSHVVVKTFLTCTMESDPPMYLAILKGLESAIIATDTRHELGYRIGTSSFVKHIVLHAQIQFESFYVREKARLNPQSLQFLSLKKIGQKLISIGYLTDVILMDPSSLDF